MVNCWISSTLTMHLSLSLLMLDVSRGHRENTLTTLYSHVTATTSYLNSSLVEVLLISTNSSTFCPENRHTLCRCYLQPEVRHSSKTENKHFNLPWQCIVSGCHSEWMDDCNNECNIQDATSTYLGPGPSKLTSWHFRGKKCTPNIALWWVIMTYTKTPDEFYQHYCVT